MKEAIIPLLFLLAVALVAVASDLVAVSHVVFWDTKKVPVFGISEEVVRDGAYSGINGSRSASVVLKRWVVVDYVTVQSDLKASGGFWVVRDSKGNEAVWRVPMVNRNVAEFGLCRAWERDKGVCEVIP